jgi:hypothetical protein
MGLSMRVRWRYGWAFGGRRSTHVLGVVNALVVCIDERVVWKNAGDFGTQMRWMWPGLHLCLNEGARRGGKGNKQSAMDGNGMTGATGDRHKGSKHSILSYQSAHH